MRPILLARRRALPARPRGAALLTAMILVTVVATLAAGMLWQQWRALQVEAAERTQTQAQWLLQGAMDWSRMILREDARSGGTDHLNEPWAAPLAEARLSTFLAADRQMSEGMPDAFLSGRIEDAQARYNLRNLIQQGIPEVFCPLEQGNIRLFLIDPLQDLLQYVLLVFHHGKLVDPLAKMQVR